MSVDRNLKKPKKRLTDINVDEVSLVDKPAIEETFAVVKREEGIAMPGENVEAVSPPGEKVEKSVHSDLVAEKIEAIKKVATEIGGLDEIIDLQAKIRQLSTLSWQLGDDAEVVQAIGKSLDGVIEEMTKADSPGPRDGNGRAMTAALEQVKALADKLLGMIGGRAKADDKADDYGKPTKKVLFTVVEDDDGDALVEGIEKSKRFTPARKTQLASVVKTLIGILKEVDPDSLATLHKEMMGDEENPKMEDDKSKKEPTKKSEDVKTPEDEIAVLKEQNEKLEKRVEELEKGRQAGNATETDNTAKVEKGEEGFWTGVL